MIEVAKESGYRTMLVTDERRILTVPQAAEFAELIAVPVRDERQAAADIAETQLGRLFSTTLDQLATCRQPYLLWVHAQAMNGPWDAPYEMREMFADEDDPDPPSFVPPPHFQTNADTDPDEILGIQQSYAAQVVVADTCLALLWDEIRARDNAEETLVCVTSTRGFPLAEHHSIGDAAPRLYGELCHVPCFLRVPGQPLATRRSQRFIQPADLAATFSDWIGGPPEFSRRWGRGLMHVLAATSAADLGPNAALATLGTQRMLRTPAWMLLDDGERTELYSKPDDRWEINDVFSRCRGEAGQMLETLDEFASAAKAGDRSRLQPLTDALVKF